MGDASYATSIGTKVIIPVATAATEPALILFTNYNGVGDLGTRTGK